MTTSKRLLEAKRRGLELVKQPIQINGFPKVRLRDLYDSPVKTYRRHKNCKHFPPCQARYRCNSKFHKGSRATPYCTGAFDTLDVELGGICDTCWVKEDKKRNPPATPMRGLVPGLKIRFVDP